MSKNLEYCFEIKKKIAECLIQHIPSLPHSVHLDNLINARRLLVFIENFVSDNKAHALGEVTFSLKQKSF